MTTAEKLEALVGRAIEVRWQPREVKTKYEYSWEWSGNEWEGYSFRPIFPRSKGEWFFIPVYELLFNHDFARASFGGTKIPNEEEIDENHSKLGLYSAEGGGYEGYGDYVYLNYEGESWQYHLQQAVISDDPIGYMYGVVFGDK